jgi:hypothetical protein
MAYREVISHTERTRTTNHYAHDTLGRWTLTESAGGQMLCTVYDGFGFKEMRDMKKWLVLIFIFLSVTRITLNAQDLHLGWNFGNLKLYGDVIIPDYNLDIDIGQLYLVKNRFSIGLNGLGIYDVRNNDAYRFLILPIEMAFLPLNYRNSIFISTYGKASWQLEKHKDDRKFSNDLYGAAGIKFFLFPEILDNHYSFYFSVFAEYDTNKKLKIGAGIDLAVVALLGVFAAEGTAKDRYEQLYPEDRRPPAW